jgi:hypothetical protein
MTSLVHLAFPKTFFVQGFSKHFNTLNVSELTQFYSTGKIEVKLPDYACNMEFGPLPDARTLRRLNRLKMREVHDLVLKYPEGVESYSSNYVISLAELMPVLPAVVEEPVSAVIIVKELDENPVEDSDSKSVDSNFTNVSSLNDDEIIMVKENEPAPIDISGDSLPEVLVVRDVVEPACTPCCVIS